MHDLKFGKSWRNREKRENRKSGQNSQNEKIGETPISGTKYSWRGQKAGPIWDPAGWPKWSKAGVNRRPRVARPKARAQTSLHWRELLASQGWKLGGPRLILAGWPQSRTRAPIFSESSCARFGNPTWPTLPSLLRLLPSHPRK